MTEQIDQIYDAHVAQEWLKAGAKYERLAALVLKVLDASAAVVHDVRVRAEGKRTLHQLDVQVAYEGRERRLLVECRDFDTGQVTQAQVMKFHSSLRQLDADGLIITNTTFSKGARSYAEDEGIALAELRPVTDADMENRVRSVQVTLQMPYPVSDPKIAWVLPDLTAEEKQQLVAALGRDEFGGAMDPRDVTVLHEGGTESVLEGDIRTALDEALPSAGVHRGEFRYDERVTIEMDGVPIPIAGFDWQIELSVHEHTISVGLDDRVPLLILKTLDGELDRVLSDRDIAAWDVAADGTVVTRGD